MNHVNMPKTKAKPWHLALAAIFCAVGVLGVADFFWTSYRLDQDVSKLRVILEEFHKADSDYVDLQARRSTHWKTWVFGTVDSAARKEVVRDKVAETFGQSEATRITGTIRIAEPATQASDSLKAVHQSLDATP